MVAQRNSHRIAIKFLTVLTLGLVMLTCSRVYAQVSGAMMTGTVSDASGAVIPNAQVSIKNVATGEVRASVADASGFYSAPNLLPGSYEISVTAPGFSTAVRKGITLTVGAQQVLDFTMQVGQATQTIEVNAEAPMIELASSTISGSVTQKEVVELPLNGRDWTSLATLQPGVTSIASIQSTASGYDRGIRGYGVDLAISGSRPLQNNYRIDGISVNSYDNSGPGSVSGGTLGVDAIQEFSVLTSNYSAEYGRTAGGVVNAITKLGTNSFHGSAYEFLRNSALDARNYFDPPTIPPFRRNQFGGSLGGPIQKGRTFFFADYEGLRQDEGVSSLLTVPSADARNGIIVGNGAPLSPGSCPANSTLPVPGTSNTCVNNNVVPFFALWGPVNDGLLGAPGTVGANAGKFRFSGAQVTTEDFVTGRVDHKFSDKDSLFVSYNYDPASITLPDSADLVLVGHQTGRQFFGIEETHIFNPQLINTFRAGFSRNMVTTGGLSAINPAAANPALGTHSPQDNPLISVSGVGAIQPGLNVEQINNYWQNSFQGYDDVFLTKGIHSLKFGVAWEHLLLKDVQDSIRDGRYSFGSFTSFLQNDPSSLRADLPGQIVNPFYFSTTIFGTYIQDDMRLRPNLTVNLGLRYEMGTGIHEKDGRLSAVYNPADPTIHVQDPWFKNPTLRNFAPRLGFAWDPFRNGKTSVRGGYGIFDVVPLTNLPFSYDVGNAPFFATGTLTGLTQGDFPTGAFTKLAGLASPPLQISYVQQNPKRDYVQQWNLSVQREIAPSLSATVTYIGSHGVHQPFRSDNANTVIPTLTSAGYLFPSPIGSGAKVAPPYGRMPILQWSNFSIYNGGEFQLTKKMSHGFQIQGSYTWSRVIDEGDGIGPSDPYLSSIADLFYFSPGYGKGPADYNATQNLTINYIWNIPTPSSFHGPVAWAARGWQVGGIFTATTGFPFTPLIGGDPLGTNAGTDAIAFPSRLGGPGCQSLTNPGNVNNYIKLQCFGIPMATPAIAAQCQPFGIQDGEAPIAGTCANLLGNGGRNEIYGPGSWNLDFSLFKNNQIKENLNLQFRAEFFNVLNHPTFQAPIDNSTLFNEDGSAAGGAGSLDTTAHSNREIQFALKLVF